MYVISLYKLYSQEKIPYLLAGIKSTSVKSTHTKGNYRTVEKRSGAKRSADDSKVGWYTMLRNAQYILLQNRWYSMLQKTQLTRRWPVELGYQANDSGTAGGCSTWFGYSGAIVQRFAGSVSGNQRFFPAEHLLHARVLPALP